MVWSENSQVNVPFLPFSACLSRFWRSYRIVQSAGGSGFRRFGIWPRSVVSAATHGLVCLSFWVSQGGVLLLVSILLHDISFNLGDTAISFPRVPWFHYLYSVLLRPCTIYIVSFSRAVCDSFRPRATFPGHMASICLRPLLAIEAFHIRCCRQR